MCWCENTRESEGSFKCLMVIFQSLNVTVLKLSENKVWNNFLITCALSFEQSVLLPQSFFGLVGRRALQLC